MSSQTGTTEEQRPGDKSACEAETDPEITEELLGEKLRIDGICGVY